MSKFIDNVQAILTGKQFAKKSPLKAWVKEEISKPSFTPTLSEFEIFVQYKMQGKCEAKYLDRMVKNFVSQFKLEIYNEFTTDILRLERAIYEQDEDTAMSIIRDIKREISVF